MRTQVVLTEPGDICSQIKSALRSGSRRIAVPFWGVGALKELGLDGGLADGARVICNLPSGACNPLVIRQLMANGADVRSLSTLHAKVYLGESAAVVGSANASTPGLGLIANGAWEEACVRVSGAQELEDLGNWFEDLWERAADLSDPQIASLLLAQADSEFAAPTDLLDALRSAPEAFADKAIHITLDWIAYSRNVEKKAQQLSRDLGQDVDAWEDWKEMPAAAQILSFHYDRKTDEISYEGTWRTPEDPVAAMDPKTRGIFVVAAPRILGKFVVRDKAAWNRAVRKFQKDLFAKARPRDKDAILQIAEFAARHLRR